jgi:hypothetical protein
MEGEEGIVVKELRKGYKFKDKLLRPSLVMVGAGKRDETRNRSRNRTKEVEEANGEEKQYG